MKQTIAACFLISLLGIPAALSMAQSARIVPQDPSAIGRLNLSKRHPSADPGPDEFERAYSSVQALQRLDQVRGFLQSFRQLTDRSRPVVDAQELRTIGNTGREMQIIGFHNIPLLIEGTLLKQEYRLNQLEYELAQMKLRQGLTTPQELDRARAAYEDATRKFQVFWDTKLPTD